MILMFRVFLGSETINAVLYYSTSFDENGPKLKNSYLGNCFTLFFVVFGLPFLIR